MTCTHTNLLAPSFMADLTDAADFFRSSSRERSVLSMATTCEQKSVKTKLHTHTHTWNIVLKRTCWSGSAFSTAASLSDENHCKEINKKKKLKQYTTEKILFAPLRFSSMLARREQAVARPGVPRIQPPSLRASVCEEITIFF